MKKPKVQSTIMPIENLSLEEFESAVYSRDQGKAVQLLVQDLRRIRAGGQFIGYSTDPALKKVLYTRFCAAIVSLLADPALTLSVSGLESIAAEHATIDLAFRASVFESGDHMLPQVTSDPTEKDQTKISFKSSYDLLKFLLVYSMRSGFKMHYRPFFEASPQATLSIYLGMMTHMLTLSKEAHERKEELLGLHDIFSECVLSDTMLPAVSDAYMYTSYGTREDKHEVKRTFNAMFRRMLEQNGIDDLPPLNRKRKKPVMLIPVEWFSSLHAMYRCYAPYIRQLRPHFRLVGIGQPMSIDGVAMQEFDQWVEVSADQIILKDIVAKVAKVAPDIVFYPSIGMALWWVALSNLRMAPIQVMMLGHPATSMSKVIDYVIVEEGTVADVHVMNEKVVNMPVGSVKYARRSDTELPPREELNYEQPDIVRVCVPAMLCKLNAPFMAACKRISEGAKTKTLFYFFVNMIGLLLHQSASEIREWIPSAVVFERTSYPEYLRFISQTHVQLSTFPFGGTNSVVDALMLGVPVVALDGREPHNRFDAMMLRHMGVPELVADSVDEYVAKAIELIDNAEARNAIAIKIREADIDNNLFGDPGTHMADAMLKIWRGEV